MKVFLKTTKGTNKAASEDRVLVGNEIFTEKEKIVELEEGHVVVADGVGGNFGGAVAAFHVCKGISELNSPLEEDFTNLNSQLIALGNENPQYKDMATTATGIYFNSRNEAIVYHVGNTRLYAIQAGQYLKQLTVDDTVVHYLVSSGKLTEEEAATYSARNEITSCFGGGKSTLLRVKTYRVDLNMYQQFLLTCDGIHDSLSVDEMEEIISENTNNWMEIATKLINKSKEKGSTDDCTAVIIDLTIEKNEKVDEKMEEGLLSSSVSEEEDVYISDAHEDEKALDCQLDIITSDVNENKRQKQDIKPKWSFFKRKSK